MYITAIDMSGCIIIGFAHKNKNKCEKFISKLRQEVGHEPQNSKLSVAKIYENNNWHYEIILDCDFNNQMAINYGFSCKNFCKFFQSTL